MAALHIRRSTRPAPFVDIVGIIYSSLYEAEVSCWVQAMDTLQMYIQMQVYTTTTCTLGWAVTDANTTRIRSKGILHAEAGGVAGLSRVRQIGFSQPGQRKEYCIECSSRAARCEATISASA